MKIYWNMKHRATAVFGFTSAIIISALWCAVFVLNSDFNLDLRELPDNGYQLNRLSDGPIMSDDPWLISHLNSSYLQMPSNEPYNLSYHSSVISSNYRKWQEKDSLTMFIQSTFANSTPGFFIEAGALDGEHFSNTLWLEQEKKWTGLLIEPDPFNCRTLISKKRKAYVSCSCVSPYKYAKATILEMPYAKFKNKDTDMLKALYKANSRSLESRFHTFKDFIQESSSFSYTTVQCFPLQTYLYALNITAVDILSLDTQGGEKNMLANFPFDKIKINWIFVEYFKSGFNPSTRDDSFVTLMKDKGFRLIKQFENEGNYIFRST